MNEKAFWEQKIIQILHDPPAKPYFLRPYSGGHKKLTLQLLDIVLPQEGPRSLQTIPDLLATGADRPLLTLPSGEGYGLGNQYFHKDPLVTHPLCRSSLQLPHPGGVPEIAGKDIDDLARWQKEAARLLAEVEAAVGDARPEELRKTFFAFWRKYRDELVRQGGNELLWQLMPADSRSPDHSIWDHTRMAAALAFVQEKIAPGREQDRLYPWLFSFSLRPVQEFLQEARKSQDLWTGSMLLAELTLAAMEPIIRRYGPDVIVYPDLRGNPRADIWLHGYDPSLLPRGKAPATRAAVIPHTFVAILPRGKGKDFFDSLENLGRATCEAVHTAWKELAGAVRGWMEEETDAKDRGSGWDRLWQHAGAACPLEPTWVALPWPALERQQKYYWPGGALPFQESRQPSARDRAVLERRRALLGEWMDSASWASYEYTLSVFARTNSGLLLHSGFCYAPAHHKLKAAHGMRRRLMTLPEPTPADLSFEKCSLCHTRAALGNSDLGQGTGDCESIREQVRKLWQERELDPEKTGSERLCAVCATKRFLVRADSKKDDADSPNRFNRVWAGPERERVGALRAMTGFSDKRIRTPFPSTVQVAAQRFLCDVAANYTDLEKEADEIIGLHRALGIQRSAFPDSLPALGRAVQEYPEALEFLTHDPQLALFPEMVESAASYADKNQGKNKDKNKDKNEKTWNNLARAVRGFREQARELGLGDPSTQVAVVCMDGDRMGKLLLHGAPEDPPVCWKHVLHPAVVKKIRSEKRFVDSGWGDLLHLPRLAGPALHAFISRALADFSHTIVPWVVEQEFDGRLIYSGGDDLLAMAPADQALAMADRLRTLYASPWIMDTWPDIAPWSWLEKDQPPQGPEQPGTRFQVIGGNEDLEQYLAELGHDRKPGRLMPMLGPGCTMSAGIMYGHFKTPLGRLLGASHELLDTWAKERAGRNSAGLGHFSRGGVKTMFAAPWDTGSLGLAHTVRLVRDAFAQPGGLPSALPYKLREQRRLLDPFDLERYAGIGEGETTRLMQGLLARAVGDAGVSDASLRAVLDLWKAGHVLLKECPDADDLAGLFFCRYLAARTKGEE